VAWPGLLFKAGMSQKWYQRSKGKVKVAKSKGQSAPFYMSTYVMDAICFMTPFPLMNWSWTPTISEPIHFYHSKLWEENAKDFFYEICHNVVVHVHIAIYGHSPPQIS
jgi:hypothetical protein